MKHAKRAKLLAELLEVSVDDIYDRAIEALRAQMLGAINWADTKVITGLSLPPLDERTSHIPGRMRSERVDVKIEDNGSGWTIGTVKCKHCKGQVAKHTVKRHEKSCRKRTPTERKAWRAKRES